MPRFYYSVCVCGPTEEIEMSDQNFRYPTGLPCPAPEGTEVFFVAEEDDGVGTSWACFHLVVSKDHDHYLPCSGLSSSTDKQVGDFYSHLQTLDGENLHVADLDAFSKFLERTGWEPYF